MIAALVFVMQVALAAPAAHADNFGSAPCDEFVMPDGSIRRSCVKLGNSREHDYRFEGTMGNQIAGIGSAVDASFAQLGGATVLTTYRSETDPYDVTLTDFSYTVNWPIAWTDCMPSSTQGGTNPYRWCQPMKIRFNGDRDGYYDTSFERVAIACHEIGHTIGLRHTTNTNSCLQTYPSSSNVISGHDVIHINNNY